MEQLIDALTLAVYVFGGVGLIWCLQRLSSHGE